MNEQVIEAQSRALAVVDEAPQQNVALFGTSDPVDVVRQATRVADALKEVIVKKKLVSNISGKEYPQVEAWQTLAVMLGLATVCEWTREVADGWEARVIVQRNGMTIAAAEAQCTRSERAWSKRDAYALRSMAQTRAVSKSLRSVLGFVMVLSGFQPTPAEEMPTDDKPPKQPAPAPSDDARRMGVEAIRRYCAKHELAVPPTDGLDVEALRAAYERLVEARKARDTAAAPASAPAPAQSAPPPEPASEPPAIPELAAWPPEHDGSGTTEETRRRLFAILRELGYIAKDARLGFAASFGLNVESFTALSEPQAEWLAARAREELLKLRSAKGG